MALNPSYAQQSTRPLPFCLGWNFVQGDPVNSILSPFGQTVNLYFLGTGEWAGNYAFSLSGNEILTNTGLLVGQTEPSQEPGLLGRIQDGQTIYDCLSFHSGSFSTIGLPPSLISLGTGQIPLATDQGTDNWLQAFPSCAPPQSFSGIAYYLAHATIVNPVILGAVSQIKPMGIWMTTRCRTFDANGNVTGYGFTTNPTWQMIETILRFEIKSQQPGLAGLLRSELACFDWPSMAAHAERNATILANGKPQFSGNWAFAADTTVAQMMEMQLRNCISYRRVRSGKIQFVGEENRTSVFTFSQRNMIPGTLKLTKKDLLNAANVYIPRFRTLEIPALTQVSNVTTPAPGGGSTFVTVGPQPFSSSNWLSYDGGNDPTQFAGDYQVALYVVTTGTTSATETVPPIPNQFNAKGGPSTSATLTAIGGAIGSPNSRFQQYAPNVVQHRAHQKSLGQVAPGITPLPKIVPVYYDLGNNTFDQTNRVMQFYCYQDLGSDVANWIAPLVGSVSGALESIDRNGAALLEVEPGDIITLDDTAAPSQAGLYQVVDQVSTQFPSAALDGSKSGSQRDLQLQTWNPAAFTQVSANPGQSYQTLQAPANLLPMADLMPATPAWWVLQATPEASYDGPTGTITIPDLTMMWQGQTAPTTYPTISISGVPVGQVITLYLVVTNMATTPTLLLNTTNLYPPLPIPAGEMILLYGTFSDVTGFSGAVVTGGSIPFGSSLALPVTSGASTGMVFTPSTPYLSGASAAGYTTPTPYITGT
jgi:hypothetical protein